MSKRKNTYSMWTVAAIECYEAGSICTGCYYNTFFSGDHKCQMKESVRQLLDKIGPPDQQKKRKGNFDIDDIKAVLSGSEGMSQTEIFKRLRFSCGNGPQFGAVLENMVNNGELESYKAKNEKHTKKPSVRLYKLKENTMNITEKEEMVLSAIKELDKDCNGIDKAEVAKLLEYKGNQLYGILFHLKKKGLVIEDGGVVRINRLTAFPTRPTEKLKEKIKIEVPEESYLGDYKGTDCHDTQAVSTRREKIEQYKSEICAILDKTLRATINVEKLAAAIEIAESLRGYKDGLDKATEIIRYLDLIRDNN